MVNNVNELKETGGDGVLATGAGAAGKFSLTKQNLRRLIIIVIIISVVGIAEFTLFVYGQFSDMMLVDDPVLSTELEFMDGDGLNQSSVRPYDNYTVTLELEIINRGRIPAIDVTIKSWLRSSYDSTFTTVDPVLLPEYDEIGILERKNFNITFRKVVVDYDNVLDFYLEIYEGGEVTERVNATLKYSGSPTFVTVVELDTEDLLQRNSDIFFLAVGIEGAVVLATILMGIFITRDRLLSLSVATLGLAPLFRIVNVATPAALDFLVFVTMSYGFLLVAVFIFIYVNDISWKDLGVTFRRLYFFMPLAIVIGLLLAPVEYIILGPPPWIPTPTIFNLIVLTMVMIFFVGLAEELMFRALIQTNLERLLSPRIGLFLTSLLFSVMHGVWTSYMELIFTFAAGLLFGYIFQRTRNLPFIAVLHGVEDVFLFGFLPFVL